MKQSILGLILLALGACSERPPQVEEAATGGEVVDAPVEASTISASAMAQWTRSCALCHVNGEGGAPKVGDADAWAPRLAQGDAILLQHTVEGLNNMPPLGYCMDCEAEDFRQIIAFMGSGT